MDNSKTTPCFVQTTQGVSISYKEKFLYSKYNPSRTILQTVENLQILPGTIILCFSPVLPYGLKELSQKLPENCIMYGCEKEEELFQICQQQLSESIENFTLLTPKQLYDLPETIALSGKYKRVIKIDFSAGVQFNLDFYNQLTNACINSVMTFWANRVTLTKFGRKYSKNLFCNLKAIENTTPISSFINKIDLPIVVFGAGESLEIGAAYIKNHTDSFFILCADTALQPLLSYGIIPDGVFIEEAQTVIAKAFIGINSANNKTQLFASLSSLPAVKKVFDSKCISYFETVYDNSIFLDKLNQEKLIPEYNKPFGSVGLTTVYYALKFRKNDSIPVYCYGLDFSYSQNKTHSRGTLANKTKLLNHNRLLPLESFSSAWNSNTTGFTNSYNHNMYTTQVLSSYAHLFKNFFYGTKNLFDSGKQGLPLGLDYKEPVVENKTKSQIKKEVFDKAYKLKLHNYFEQEKQDLLLLKSILTGQTKLPEEEMTKKIRELAEQKEYLFLHFPDGYCFNMSQSFLNRIRIEIDYFLKWI